MKNIYQILISIIIFTSLFIYGCWLPEKFEANIIVNDDGSYTFEYEGVLTFALALAAEKEGKLSAKDEKEFEELQKELGKEEGFKEVKYLGKGRYLVHVKLEKEVGQKTVFVSSESKLFYIDPQIDGNINISSFKLNKKDLSMFKEIGAKVEGELNVNVAKGVEVVEHNAQSVPKLMGMFGSYTWAIKSPDVGPMIIVRPTNSEYLSKIEKINLKNKINKEPQWLKDLLTNEIIPGVGMAGVKLGDPINDVLQRFGKPKIDSEKKINYANGQSKNVRFVGYYENKKGSIGFLIDKQGKITNLYVIGTKDYQYPRVLGTNIFIGEDSENLKSEFGKSNSKYSVIVPKEPTLQLTEYIYDGISFRAFKYPEKGSSEIERISLITIPNEPFTSGDLEFKKID